MRIVGEYIIKILKRIFSIFKVVLWKILFLNGLQCPINTVFYPGCKMMIEHNGYIKIGRNCFFNHRCSMTSMNKIEIGDNCTFGENILIYDHNHEHHGSDIPIKEQGYEVGSIQIGSNCWIGSNVVILANSKIGDNVVIAAGSIVFGEVPDNSVFIQKRVTTIKDL